MKENLIRFILIYAILLFLNPEKLALAFKGVANEFSYDAKSGLLKLEGEVFIEGKGFKISADLALIDEKVGKSTFWGDVLFSSPVGDGKASKAVYDSSSGLLYLEDGHVKRGKFTLTSRYMLFWGQDSLEASGDVVVEQVGVDGGLVAKAGQLSLQKFQQDKISFRDNFRMEYGRVGLKVFSSYAEVWIGVDELPERVIARGSVQAFSVLRGEEVSAEAASAEYDVRREELRLDGDVVISSSRGFVKASSALVNIKSGTIRSLRGKAFIGLE